MFLYRRSAVRHITQLICGCKNPHKWLFIVGCYNSGTTLLQRLLSKHPDISTLPREGVTLTYELPRPEDYGWTRMWAECLKQMQFTEKENPKKANKIIKDWSPFFDNRCSIFLEKSIVNLPRMEWIDKNFSNAYFLGIIRNPYAVCEGIRRRAKPKSPVNKKFPDGYPINLTAKQWLTANSMLQQQKNKVKRFALIKYEDLVSAPVRNLQTIYDYLQIAHPDMSFVNQALTINGKGTQIINMNDVSIKRLSHQDLMEINRVLGNFAKNFGYKIIQCLQ